METTLESVDLIFHRRLPDGTTIDVQATIDPDYGYQQWGAELSVLSENVDALTAIEDALVDMWEDPEADETP